MSKSVQENNIQYEVFDSMELGLVIVNNSMFILDCNDYFCHMSNRKKEDIINIKLNKLLYHNINFDKFLFALDTFQRQKENRTKFHELMIVDEAGNKKWVIIKASRKKEMILIMFMEIEDIKRKEQDKYIMNQKHKDRVMQKIRSIRLNLNQK